MGCSAIEERVFGIPIFGTCCAAQLNGTYVQLVTWFEGGGPPLMESNDPENPGTRRWTRYRKQIGRLQSTIETDWWIEVEMNWPTVGSGQPPSIIRRGPNWEPGRSFTISNRQIFSHSEDSITWMLNFGPDLPNGGWHWTVTGSDPVTIHNDLALSIEEMDNYPFSGIPTENYDPIFDVPSQWRIYVYEWKPDSGTWGEPEYLDPLINWFGTGSGATERINKLTGSWQLSGIEWRDLTYGSYGPVDGNGDYPWPPQTIPSGSEALTFPWIRYAFSRVYRRLNDPFATTTRCKYWYATDARIASFPIIKEIFCDSAAYLSGEVVKPELGDFPEEYTYLIDGPSSDPFFGAIYRGHVRTQIIPPDSAPGGTPDCCSGIIAP